MLCIREIKMKKLIKISALIFAFLLTLAACGEPTEADTTLPAEASSQSENNSTDSSAAIFITEDPTVKHPIVKFTMENGGTFTMKLYPEYAPETVENFVSLVSSGFYNGLTFHRVIDGFMAQGGDPTGTGFHGSDKKIKGEFSMNGFYENTIPHNRGVVSMARSSNSYDSASSQFFICYTSDYAFSLNGNYAAFGYVFDGMETVDAFLNIERAYDAQGQKSKPVEPIVIKTAEVIG